MIRPAFCVTLLATTLTAQIDSFESLPVGPIPQTGSASRFGTWLASGDAEISTRRARTGEHSLRILGGKDRRASLQLKRDHKPARVSFWAERWTRRQPFDLRVEAWVRGDWKLVYRDRGQKIAVGGYRSHIEFRVPHPFDVLRFSCTSPKNSGVLIDDLSIAIPKPMRIVSVVAKQPIAPILLGRKRNPVVCIRVDTEGHLGVRRIAAIRWSLRGSKRLRDVARVRVFHTTRQVLPTTGALIPFGEATTPKAEFTIDGEARLKNGANFFWLSVEMNAQADLDGYLDGGCLEVETSLGKKTTPENSEPAGRQRFGVAVRDRSDDGAHTYRIPGLTTTDRGTLVGVYDIRRRSGGDLPGDIDVGMSRSTDGGRTWETMRVIMDMGDAEEWRYDGVGDPAILFDKKKHTLWVAATWSHGNRSWNGSGPGMAPQETGQLMLVKSTDDGRTWSKPINITKQVKNPAWCFVLQSPGRGIMMADGTLVFGAQYQDTPEKKRTPHSTIIWSKDHGESWHIGTGARANTTECQPVEVAPGRIMLNMRDNRRGPRSVFVTDDLGATWREHATHRKALIEPTCNAALLRIRDGARPWLAFVNPAVARAPRRHMTIKLSTDAGGTWPETQQLRLDSGHSSGYPSATMVDADTIGILYEGSRAQMTFQRVTLAELRGKPR
jgi:sialidase-1